MLSDTQQTILDLITQRIDADGVPPSQAEIASALGFKGVRAAQYHLDILEQAGAIKRIPGQARGIRLGSTGDAKLRSPVRQREVDDSALRLPVLGRVAAGTPIGNDALDADNVVLIDRSFFFPTPDYLLKVKGDSMRDDGIFDGDLIGVHRTGQARSGDIVIARVDEEITVKRLKIGKDGIRLLPRNPDYAPIEVRPDQDFAIEGLYCGLVRPSR
ncbi:MAG: transcriptional repressor LexA [Arenimonas sp.]